MPVNDIDICNLPLMPDYSVFEVLAEIPKANLKVNKYRPEFLPPTLPYTPLQPKHALFAFVPVSFDGFFF